MPATFPHALKVFSVFHDYTDIIYALSVNEMHDEIIAIESTLGLNPFATTTYTTFGGAIQDLYNNKAPTTHTHEHKNLLDDTQGNDHPQYIQVTGAPGFSHPVSGHAGTASSDLVPLSQLQAFGYQNSAQVASAVDRALVNLMTGVQGGAPLLGSTSPTPSWRLNGGVIADCTDDNGWIFCNFGDGYANCVQAIVATKLPPQPGSPCPPYNWIEAQLTLVQVFGDGFQVQFSHDYSIQANMSVCFSWLSIGT